MLNNIKTIHIFTNLVTCFFYYNIINKYLTLSITPSHQFPTKNPSFRTSNTANPLSISRPHNITFTWQHRSIHFPPAEDVRKFLETIDYFNFAVAKREKKIPNNNSKYVWNFLMTCAELKTKQ